MVPCNAHPAPGTLVPGSVVVSDWYVRNVIRVGKAELEDTVIDGCPVVISWETNAIVPDPRFCCDAWNPVPVPALLATVTVIR